jgi:hypothetical protein
MTLFSDPNDLEALMNGTQEDLDKVPGICQECRHIHMVSATEPQACTLHEQPAPILTVQMLFQVLAQINAALKQTPTDAGVLAHKETFLSLMRTFQAAEPQPAE